MLGRPTLQLVQTILTMSQLYGRPMTEAAVGMLADDLAGYPEHQVLKALARCRLECRSFPATSEIIARIDDGRPGVEEAWAMVPKDEGESIVWTDEMAEAFGVAAPLLEDDPIAARMAFKETYGKLLADARAGGRPARWTPSLGHDRAGREIALRTAVTKGRIALEQAARLIPELESDPRPLRLPPPPEVSEAVRSALKQIPRALPSPAAAEPTVDEIEHRRLMLKRQLEMLRETEVENAPAQDSGRSEDGEDADEVRGLREDGEHGTGEVAGG